MCYTRFDSNYTHTNPRRPSFLRPDMYQFLKKYIPQPWCDWLVAGWLALLVVLIFVLWDTDVARFHYIEI